MVLLDFMVLMTHSILEEALRRGTFVTMNYDYFSLSRHNPEKSRKSSRVL
jgi:hypothetical protein